MIECRSVMPVDVKSVVVLERGEIDIAVGVVEVVQVCGGFINIC